MFAGPSHFAAPTSQPYVTFATATWETRGVIADGTVVNVRFVEPIIVIHEPFGFGGYWGYHGTQPTEPVQPTQPPPVVVSGNDGGPADSGQSAEVGSGTGSVIAQPHVAAHTPAATPANPAISNPAESNNAATPTAAAQAAAAVQASAVQATQIQVAITAPVSTGRIGPYANTAVLGSADELPAPPPPSSAEPPLSVTPSTATSETETPTAPTTSDPVAGLLPFDLSTLSATASQFLGRVADLAPSWPDGMPSVSDSIWMAAIGVLGGGAIYAATNRPARPARDAFGSASALSEWERRNARSAG
jgi:hypothetical protein